MRKLLLIAVLSNSILLFSCNKDEKKDSPSPEVENEIITTVQISLKDSLTDQTTSFKWENLGGYGLGSVTTIDTIKLEPNKTYLATILLLNKTNLQAIDTISNEVAELKNEHQFFYNSTANIVSSYINSDVDDHNVPVGLFPKFKTGSISKGNLELTLKHQPGVKPKTGNGDINQGSTDVMVSFPVDIK
jgi:hypothetical protein